MHHRELYLCYPAHVENTMWSEHHFSFTVDAGTLATRSVEESHVSAVVCTECAQTFLFTLLPFSTDFFFQFIHFTELCFSSLILYIKSRPLLSVLMV